MKNKLLIASIGVLSVAVVTLTTLIIREGKPVQYDNLYDMQEDDSDTTIVDSQQQEVATEAPEEPEKVIMVTTRVNIRDRDSEDGIVLDTVEEGAIFEFVEVLGSGWTHIKYEDMDAFINSKYVKLIDKEKALQMQKELQQKATEEITN